MSKRYVRIEDEKKSLVIRSATLEDATIITNWWNDGEVMNHAGFPNGLNQSVEQTKELIKENETKFSQICMIETEGKPIGEMSFKINERIGEIGIKICERAYQNRGLGTKLIHMLIKFLFNDPKINSNGHVKKIILNTDLKNIRAQHVYEKIGFRRMYVHENSWKDQLGNLRSSVGYELTRGQYKDR